MKLYSAQLSPFAARVRLAIYAKSLPVEIMAPPGGGLKSPEYLAINPMGKVPTLVLDDGTVIPESDTIVEFLADAFPDAGLRPTRPSDIARGRLLARMAELYVMAPSAALFGQMNPAARDPAVVEAALAKMDDGMGHLNLFMTEEAYAVGGHLTTADCALAPLLFFQDLFGQTFGKDDLVARHAKVSAYWGRLQRNPVVQKVLAEMQEGLANFMKR